MFGAQREYTSGKGAISRPGKEGEIKNAIAANAKYNPKAN
jgi:hypothetical protein